MTMSCDDGNTNAVQRFEVFTGAGRRREWPRDVKASIVAESYSGGETVCEVARRHGLAPNQLFRWRGEFRKELEARGLALPIAAPAPPSFVPAVIDPVPVSDPAPASRRRRKRRRLNAGAVELEIDGVSVTIGRGADAATISVVIEALKAGR